jgi:hypothetical protein
MSNPETKENQNTSAKAPAPKERRYLVKETAAIPRGGSHFTLPKGKVISSLGFDIEALKRQGVKLEEATA